MKFLLFSIINTLILIPGTMLRFFPFKEIYNENQKKKMISAYLILMLTDFFVFYFLCKDANINLMHIKLNMITVGLISTSFNIRIKKEFWKEHLFTFGFSMLEDFCVIFLCSYIYKYIKGLDELEYYILGSVLYLAIYGVTFYYWNKLLIMSVTPFLKLNSSDFWKSRWFISVSLFITCYLAMPGEPEYVSIWHVISNLFILSSAIFICISISRSPAMIIALREMHQRIIFQEEYYHNLSEQVERDRKLRHDFKHHILAIREFMKRDDKEGLSLYCDQLQESSVVQKVVIPYTGNAVVDGIVYHYAQLCEEHQIAFDYPSVYKGAVIDNMDFGVLLGNALENAIAGCLTVPEGRFICITAEDSEYGMNVMISNSFDGKVEEKNGMIFSRKRNHEPGIGLSSMKSICEKNNGEMDIRYDDKVFSLLFCFLKQRNL